MLLAAAVGAFGALVCTVTVAVAPPSITAHPWGAVATVTAGSVLVQVVAELVGTGLGLLIRPTVVAFLATIAVPLGLWFVLGSLDILRPAQAWLAPYATVQNLLSGRMSPLAWSQWSVVFLLWGAGLNAVGAARVKRRTREGGLA